MIAAIDIGNSNIHLCLINAEGKIHSLKNIPTYNPTNYEKHIKSYINAKLKSKISNIIISSVVPKIGNYINKLCIKELNIYPVFINYKTETPLIIKLNKPESIGSDRICNAVAGYELFDKKNNIIVVDAGTAITYDIIFKEGFYIGGLIMPGVNTMLYGLNAKTSKLPLVDKNKLYRLDNKTIGKSTVDSILKGIYLLITESFPRIIHRISKDYNKNFRVIITGGDKLIFKNLNMKHYISSENLVLKGLYYISKHNGFI